MRSITAALIVVFALAATADSASARKRFRLFSGSGSSSSHSADASSKRLKVPIVVPIPGGSSGNVVKVLDLPDTPMFRRPDGRYVDLGWRFTAGDSGEWVGYVGSSSQFLRLSQEALSGMMLVAGRKELPPPPKRSSSGGMLALLLIAGVIGAGLLKKFVFGAGRAAAKAAGDLSAAGGSQAPDWVARAEQRVGSGAPTAMASASTRRTPPRLPSVQTVTAPGAPRPAFGRRA
ncbi:MAG: hypothetical protein ACT4OU_11320 [Hyphomicrobium sp.]